MNPVYQRIIDPQKGDCFKAVICSLLELDYEAVPNFIELPGNEWWTEAVRFFETKGYELGGEILYNPKMRFLESPTDSCFLDCEYDGPTLSDLKETDGIGGYFMASVYSPGFTVANAHPSEHLHCVICDKDFNIVHDPNEKYKGIFEYPYSRLIGYNGIRSIDTIRKI